MPVQTHKKGACEDVCTCDVIQRRKKKIENWGQKRKWCEDTEHHGTPDGYEMERSRDEDKFEGRRVMKEKREGCKR